MIVPSPVISSRLELVDLSLPCTEDLRRSAGETYLALRDCGGFGRRGGLCFDWSVGGTQGHSLGVGGCDMD